MSKYIGPVPTLGDNPAPAQEQEQPPVQTEEQPPVQPEVSPVENNNTGNEPPANQTQGTPELPHWLRDSQDQPLTEETYREYLDRAKKAEQLEQQIQEMQGHNPFANEIAKRVNDLVGKGASLAEVSNFLQMQQVDPNSMAPLDAIRMAAKAEYPDFTDGEIDAFLATRKGLQSIIEADEDNPPTNADQVALKLAHKEAIKKIEELKVSASEPASIQEKLAAERKEQDLQRQIFEVAKKSVPEKFTVPLGESQSIELPVSPDLIEHIQNAVAQTGKANGGFASDDEARDLAFRFLAFNDPSAFARTMYEHGVALGRKQAVEAASGIPQSSTNRPANSPQQPPARIDPRQLIG